MKKRDDMFILPEIQKDEAIDWQGARAIANMNGALLQYGKVWEYSKDLSGNYWGGDQAFASLGGVSNIRELVGAYDELLPWKVYANVYKQQDKALVKTKRLLTLDRINDAEGNEVVGLSSKAIVQDYQGNPVGLFGCAVNLSSLNQEQLGSFFSDVLKLEEYSQQFKHQVSVNGRLVVLAKCEAEVLHYLARGKTAKEIGRILSLSNRTVESYLSNARNKTGCINQSQLIDLYWGV